MAPVFVLSACRTPIGKFLGAFSDVPPPDLASAAVRGALERAGVEASDVEETIFGCARQAGNGPNVARQVAVRSGIPDRVPAFTVNKACASSLKALALG